MAKKKAEKKADPVVKTDADVDLAAVVVRNQEFIQAKKQIKELTSRVNSMEAEQKNKKYCVPYLFQVLGWLRMFEERFPANATWFPSWLTDIEAWHEAIEQGYVELKRTVVDLHSNREGQVYGLTEKGKSAIESFIKAKG